MTNKNYVCILKTNEKGMNLYFLWCNPNGIVYAFKHTPYKQIRRLQEKRNKGSVNYYLQPSIVYLSNKQMQDMSEKDKDGLMLNCLLQLSMYGVKLLSYRAEKLWDSGHKLFKKTNGEYFGT